MKLLVVSRQAAFSEGIGGMERAVADQVTDFLDLGIDVRLVVPDSDALGALPLGLTCVSVPWPGWNKGGGRPTYGLAYLFWCMRLRKWLDQNVFHDESILFHGASVGSLTSRLANDHFVVSNPHGMEEFKFSILRWPNRVFIRALSRRGKLASKIVSTDRSLTPVVQKNLGCDLDKIILIPNSVNVPYLDRCSQNASKDRDTFSIVSVGRLAPNKGYDLLLEALIDLEERGILPPNTSWTHFGKGEQKSKLLKRFNGDSRKFGFSVIENAPDAIVQTALASSTLFVQPSRYEGSSLTTLEAMTQSCLIVATPVGGIPDKIRHHQNGFLASEVTAQALADCIATAMESDSQELRDAARLHVLTHFSSVSTSQQYFELFQSRTASAV